MMNICTVSNHIWDKFANKLLVHESIPLLRYAKKNDNLKII